MQSEICIVNSNGVITGTLNKTYEDDGFEYKIKRRITEYDKIVSDDYVYPHQSFPLIQMLVHLKNYYETYSGCISSLRLQEKMAIIRTTIGWVEFYLEKVEK